MTSDTSQRGVLVLGRSQRVIGDAVTRLRELGYKADATGDFLGDVASRFNPKEIDLVIFGGQIPPDRKAELQAEISAINPHVIFVQGLAGIPGLIADQVQQALDGERLIPGQSPRFDATRRAVMLNLFAPRDVSVTACWLTEIVPPDPKSDSRTLFDDRLAAGQHIFTLPDDANLNAAFATVRAAGARWCFQLT